MLDWKTRKVWMLYLFGNCFLVGIIQRIDKGLVIGGNISFNLGAIIGLSMMIFGSGALLALVAGVLPFLKKKKLKLFILFGQLE